MKNGVCIVHHRAGATDHVFCAAITQLLAFASHTGCAFAGSRTASHPNESCPARVHTT
jgi:hypothetical protein